MEKRYKEFKESAVEYQLRAVKKEFKQGKISSSNDAAEYARNFYFDDISIFESVFVLLLNNAGNTIGYAKISQGGITGTIVDIRIILKYAIDNLATKMILFHNHPSGNLIPSEHDINMVEKLKQACGWMDVELLDSIILTEDGYYSFADEGQL